MRRRWIWALVLAVRGSRRVRRKRAGDAGIDAGLQRHDAREGHVRRSQHQGQGRHDPTVPGMQLWKAELKTHGDSDLYVQQNTWDPSACTAKTAPACPRGSSSRLAHASGPSLVIVTQGTVTAYEGDDPTCTPHVYSANGTNAFVDIGGGDVHIIRDESGAVAKTVAVQLIPKGATRRIDVYPLRATAPF